ncbi:MAG: ATP-binding protein [Chitinispirillales bacterium]|jgi:anti-sigma regulatory factor (Ser/Thr protein kinase)|nr:ATP-binding protein [Chitinispirillales bacterium]
MELPFPYKITVTLPSDLEIIPSIRKFISETLQVSGFSTKFAFRSEIIIDEICNNAICYGSEGEGDDKKIELSCEIHDDRMEVMVKDHGGSSIHTERLKEAVSRNRLGLPLELETPGLGLEIVKLLSETIEFTVDENNVTSIHAVRKREEEIDQA